MKKVEFLKRHKFYLYTKEGENSALKRKGYVRNEGAKMSLPNDVAERFIKKNVAKAAK